MFEFLSAHAVDLAVGAVVIALAVLATVKIVRDKKRGKNSCGGSCGGGCEGCPMHGECH